MSDFEFVLVEKIGFTLQQTVFEFVIGGSRGATGAGLPSGGDAGDGVQKNSSDDYDFGILKNNLFAIIPPTINDDALAGYGVDSRWIDQVSLDVYQCLDSSAGAAVWKNLSESGGNSRDDHGPISVTEGFSANFTEHTATIAASMDFTFADFSATQPRIDIEATISGGNPDVSLPAGFVVTSDSQQTLTGMASGVYDIVVKSYDNGASGIITVSQAEASATSSITLPIYTTDNIALLFSEAQNPATVLTIGNGTGTVELFNVTAGVFVPAGISTADNTAWALNPDSDMTAGNDYELYLKKEITSLVGNRKYGGENLTFTAQLGSQWVEVNYPYSVPDDHFTIRDSLVGGGIKCAQIFTAPTGATILSEVRINMESQTSTKDVKCELVNLVAGEPSGSVIDSVVIPAFTTVGFEEKTFSGFAGAIVAGVDYGIVLSIAEDTEDKYYFAGRDDSGTYTKPAWFWIEVGPQFWNELGEGIQSQMRLNFS